MQTRTNEYNTPIVSDEENKSHIGTNPPGRYTGFDTIAYPGSGSTFSIGHGGTGFVATDVTGTATPPMGLVITKHGVRITESSSIPGLILTTNAGNASNRIDLLVVTHDYILTPGGQPAVYSIITGPTGSYVAPALTNPTRQIIIGEIHLRAGVTAVQALTHIVTPPSFPTAADGIYIASKVPGTAGKPDLRANELVKMAARFDTADKVDPLYLNLGSGYVSMELSEVSNTYLHVDQGGSSFLLKCIKKPTLGNSGVKIVYMVPIGGSDDFVIVNDGGSIPAGYAPINVPTNLHTSIGTGVPVGLAMGAGDIVILEFLNNEWVVTNFMALNSASLPNTWQKPPLVIASGTVTGPTAGTNIAMGTTILNNYPDLFGVSGGYIQIRRPGVYKVDMLFSFDLGSNTNIAFLRYATDSNTTPTWDKTTGDYIIVDNASVVALVPDPRWRKFTFYYNKTTTTSENIQGFIHALSNTNTNQTLVSASCSIEVTKIG